MAIYDNPAAIWGGILGTLRMSFLGIESGTQDRFTGTEGDILRAKIEQLES